MLDSDIITLLEDWVQADKAHSAEISIGNGNKLSCWTVTLFGKSNKSVVVDEVAHIEHDQSNPPPNYLVAAKNSTEWPGLGRTIIAAVDRAKELGI